jgi:hypothetical protein
MKLESSQLKALIQEGVREKLEELTGKDPQKLQEFLDWLFKKQGVSDLEKKAGLSPLGGDVGSMELEKSKGNKAYLKANKEAAEISEKLQRALTKLANVIEAAAEADPATSKGWKQDLMQLNKFRKSVRDGAEKAGLAGRTAVFEDGDRDTRVKSLPRVAGTVDMGKGPAAFSSELDRPSKKAKGGRFQDEKGKESEFESLLESMGKELSKMVK